MTKIDNMIQHGIFLNHESRASLVEAFSPWFWVVMVAPWTWPLHRRSPIAMGQALTELLEPHERRVSEFWIEKKDRHDRHSKLVWNTQCQHKWTRIVRNWKDFIVSLCFFSFFILRLTLYSCRPAVEPLIGYFVPVAQLSVFQEDSASYIQLGRNTVIFRVAMQSGSFEELWGYFPRLCREFLRLSVWRKKQCDDFQSRRLHTFREQSVTWEPRKSDTTDTHVHRKLAYL